MTAVFDGALSAPLLTLALVASITPLGVLGVFAVSGNGRRGNGVAFLGGWAAILAVLAVLGATVFHGTVRTDTEPSRWLHVATALLGVALVAAAFVVRARRGRPAPAGAPAKKTLQERLDGLGGAASFTAGVAMAPFPVGLATGALLMQSEAGIDDRLLALLVVIALCTWPMIAIVVVLFAGSDAVRARFDRWHHWIDEHRGDIAFWGLIVIGLAIGVPAAIDAIRG